jgi:hypothetical protein
VDRHGVRVALLIALLAIGVGAIVAGVSLLGGSQVGLGRFLLLAGLPWAFVAALGLVLVVRNPPTRRRDGD